MNRSTRLTALSLAGIALLSFAVWKERQEPPAKEQPPAVAGVTWQSKAADRPDIAITPDHELAGVRHKDAKGLSPLETVNTPDGVVTIQRTFSTEGKLLEEKAFLDGELVPVPDRNGP